MLWAHEDTLKMTQDPALPPSERWRWAGVLLNGVGFVRHPQEGDPVAGRH